MFLESSKDILFLVLAFCALWFTAFVCWALYYVISVLRDAANLMEEIHERVRAVDEAVRAVRDKIEHSMGYLGMAATGVKAVLALLERRKEKMVEKAKKKVRKVAEELLDEE